ncbi:MAG: TIGR00303 family protein [Methanoregula sp.]|nr:MAG: TIGR00303 family protein [Methanoregula sp.]
MAFVTEIPPLQFKKPVFCSILGNTRLSTVPGISGAGPTPEKTLFTPALDAELIVHGSITSMPAKPNTPTGCPTPATITRAMMELTGISPLFINAGLAHNPTVPCLDVYGGVGADPREQDAIPCAEALYQCGIWIGKFLSGLGDLLVLGECVPGGTTTALCVLRALGYSASVSSSFVKNPLSKKEEVSRIVIDRIRSAGITDPLNIIRATGDPMMPVACGIARSYSGNLILAGGTQMLSVAGLVRAMGGRVPLIATTSFVRDDPSANVIQLSEEIGVKMVYVDPGFEDLGHSGLARYCIGEVKEGMGAGGAMLLAYLMGHSPVEIREKIYETVSVYS